jgi:hypothetical protein
MDIGTMALILFCALAVFFFLLGTLTRGTGAGVVDVDPARRAKTRRELDEEDAAQLAEVVNGRRRLRELPPPGPTEDGD